MRTNKSATMLKKKIVLQKNLLSIQAKNLVFSDESGVNLKQAPRYARAFGGHRMILPIPFIRGEKYSVMAAITHDVLDNVSFYHQAGVRKKIENTGAKVLYLP